MKLFWKPILTAVALSLLAGCASNLNVTYYSDPPGAVLYAGQQRFGYTPYTLTYPVSEEDKKRGYMFLQGASVRWVSGATAEVNPLKVDLRNGLSQQFTFQRPNGVPGRETDERFVLELERARAMRLQAEAQQRQAAAQEERARAEKERARAEMYNTNKPINCTTRVFGNIVKTECY